MGWFLNERSLLHERVKALMVLIKLVVFFCKHLVISNTWIFPEFSYFFMKRDNSRASVYFQSQ